MPNTINLRLLDNKNIIAEMQGIPLANENSYKIIAGEENATIFNIVSKPTQYTDARYTVEMVNSQGFGIAETDIIQDTFTLPNGMAVAGYGWVQIRAYQGDEVIPFIPLKLKVWNTIPDWKEYIIEEGKITQSLGDAENKVISQKVVTEKINKLTNSVSDKLSRSGGKVTGQIQLSTQARGEGVGIIAGVYAEEHPDDKNQDNENFPSRKYLLYPYEGENEDGTVNRVVVLGNHTSGLLINLRRRRGEEKRARVSVNENGTTNCSLAYLDEVEALEKRIIDLEENSGGSGSGGGSSGGTVTAVNGIEPDEYGNVWVGADDVGATPYEPVNGIPLVDPKTNKVNDAYLNTQNENYELIEKIIIGYSITTAQPDDWTTNYTAYFTNTGTEIEPIYTAVAGDTAPTWEAGKYYKYTDEASTLLRNKEPDGKPYNFKHLIVMYEVSNKATKAEYLYTHIKLKQNNLNVPTALLYFPNTGGIKANAKTFVSNQLIRLGKGLYRGFQSTGQWSWGDTNVYQYGQIMNRYLQATTPIAEDAYIAEISTSQALPPQSIVYIYAVRN